MGYVMFIIYDVIQVFGGFVLKKFVERILTKATTWTNIIPIEGSRNIRIIRYNLFSIPNWDFVSCTNMQEDGKRVHT